MKDPGKTITFRLSRLQWLRLCEAAGERGVSAGVLARRLVLEALENSNSQAVEQQVAKLGEQVEQVRVLLARAAVAILCDAGKCSQEEAADWVTQEFLRHGESEDAFDRSDEERPG